MNAITLITSASRGLGRNTVLSIAQRNDDVILTYRDNRDAADALVAQVEALVARKLAHINADVGSE